jgi:hypothetical protein
MFNQMKNRWGWKDTWQQSRQELHRWSQIIATGYALPQLLVMQGPRQLHELAHLAPWRKSHPLTAGRLRLGLQRIFAPVDSRSLWKPKSGKFGPTKGTVRDKQPPEVEKQRSFDNLLLSMSFQPPPHVSCGGWGRVNSKLQMLLTSR